MTQKDIKIQIFQTREQWNSGLLYGVKMMEAGGITLFSMPGFEKWLPGLNGIAAPVSLAIDQCSQVYFVDARTHTIYCYDPNLAKVTPVWFFNNCGKVSGELKTPGKAIIDKFSLWIMNLGKRQVQAFSLENFQIKFEIADDLDSPIDFALDKTGHLFVLDNGAHQIAKYKTHGSFIKNFGDTHLINPLGLAIGEDNIIYVIDGSSNTSGFITFSEEGDYLGIAGDFSQITGDFQPIKIVRNANGNLFVQDRQTNGIYQFDGDGSYVGRIEIPDNSGSIESFALDNQNNLYLSTSKGIAFFSAQIQSTGTKGVYYTKTLDSGVDDNQWHRLALNADIPRNTAVEAYYASTNDPAIRQSIDDTLANSHKSTQEKANVIDNTLSWIGPEQISDSILFRNKTRRYLWLKLALSTFDENEKPVIHKMQVFYPRFSWLQYLPATYQENQASRDFLERYLAIFETILYDLDVSIGEIFKYFDPNLVSNTFINWLASWVNLILEEDWDEERKRQFLLKASTLYKQKGTVSGIAALLELYTGKEAYIQEHSQVYKPRILGNEFILGVNSNVIRKPVTGFRLNDDAILGRSAIRDEAQLFLDPFAEFSYQFTVLLNMDKEEFVKYENGIKRILNEEKPAHTEFRLRLIGDSRNRSAFYIGINSRVADFVPFTLGNTATVGYAIITIHGEPGDRIGRNLKLEKGIYLI